MGQGPFKESYFWHWEPGVFDFYFGYLILDSILMRTNGGKNKIDVKIFVADNIPLNLVKSLLG